MDASWLKLTYLQKIVMNTPWPLEVSLKKEDILKDIKIEMFGLCEFRGFVAIITTISNNARLTYTRCMLPMKELFSNRKREE